MPANDFEKQAKQLLDELKFRPNEEVWIQVEKRIREKKRRRWLILLPLLAGLAVGGYFIAEQYTKGNEQLVTTGTPGKTTATNEVIKEEPDLKEENTNKENGFSEPMAKENSREVQRQGPHRRCSRRGCYRKRRKGNGKPLRSRKRNTPDDGHI